MRNLIISQLLFRIRRERVGVNDLITDKHLDDAGACAYILCIRLMDTHKLRAFK
jgi:hypothetical protein